MIGLIVAAILMGGNLFSFVDAPSLILVLGATICGAFISFPTARVLAVFPFRRRGSPEESAQQAAVLDRMADLSVASGVMGTVIGLVMMLQNLDDPTAIGPAMAVALLTLLYGVIMGELVFRSLAASCRSETGDVPALGGRRGAVSIYVPVASLFIVLLSFFVMLLAMWGPGEASHEASVEASEEVVVEEPVDAGG